MAKKKHPADLNPPKNGPDTRYRITNTTTTHVYPWHDPDEIISGRTGMVEAQKDIYGPNYHGRIFKPEIGNIRTGRIGKHHCPVADCGVPKEKCYTHGYLGYCPEFEEVDGDRFRCGEALSLLLSCSRHPRSLEDSMSRKMFDLYENHIPFLTWADFNDPVEMDKYREGLKNPAADVEAAVEQNNVKAEQLYADGNCSKEAYDRIAPHTVHNTHIAATLQKTRDELARSKEVDRRTMNTLVARCKGKKVQVPDKNSEMFKGQRRKEEIKLAGEEKAEAEAKSKPAPSAARIKLQSKFDTISGPPNRRSGPGKQHGGWVDPRKKPKDGEDKENDNGKKGKPGKKAAKKSQPLA